MATIPNGEMRRVQADEMFFSTTNRRGVINGANSIFARISRIPRDELLGSPHNIIRHPDMPGGTFRLMWDALLNGKPFAGYVQSMARDGFGYWVFATITPLDGGFLSVRTAPCVPELWHRAAEIYGQAAPVEDERRDAGGSRIEAALDGCDAIVKSLNALGLPSYEDFMLVALPAEVAARSAQSLRRSGIDHITGELGDVLRGARDLDHEIALLLARLDDFDRLAAALHGASKGAADSVGVLREVTEIASRASASVTKQAPVLARAGEAMSILGGQVASDIGQLSDELAVIRRWVMRLRFRIALSQLHSDMVTSFAFEVLDGGAEDGGLSYIPMLCAALSEGVEQVAVDMDAANGRLRGVASDIESVSGKLREYQKFLSTWRNLVPRFNLSKEFGPYIGPIDEQLMDGHGQISALRSLAEQCVAQAQPFNRAALLGPIERISDVAKMPPKLQPALQTSDSSPQA